MKMKCNANEMMNNNELSSLRILRIQDPGSCSPVPSPCPSLRIITLSRIWHLHQKHPSPSHTSHTHTCISHAAHHAPPHHTPLTSHLENTKEKVDFGRFLRVESTEEERVPYNLQGIITKTTRQVIENGIISQRGKAWHDDSHDMSHPSSIWISSLLLSLPQPSPLWQTTYHSMACMPCMPSWDEMDRILWDYSLFSYTLWTLGPLQKLLQFPYTHTPTTTGFTSSSPLISSDRRAGFHLYFTTHLICLPSFSGFRPMELVGEEWWNGDQTGTLFLFTFRHLQPVNPFQTVPA